MSDPLNVYALDDVRFITRKEVDPIISTRKSIEKAIDIYFNPQTSEKALQDLMKEYNITVDERLDLSVLDDIQNAPAVRLAIPVINCSGEYGMASLTAGAF